MIWSASDQIDLVYNAFARSDLRNRARRRNLSSAYSKPLDRVGVLGNNADYGHRGCVNALSWANENVLLSGGDDTTIRLWRMDDYGQASSNELDDESQSYSFSTSAIVQTGHTDNIFGVRCLPTSTRVATVARDSTVRVFDLATANALTGSTIGVKPRSWPGSPTEADITYSQPQLGTCILKCHRDSVKRIIAQEGPDRFLTVSEDRMVRQHDLRTPHTCRQHCPPPLMRAPFDLSTFSSSPLAPHHFIVGGECPYGFLFDRRHIREIRREWGEVPGLSEENLTQCVLKFGRPKDRSPRSHDHITGSKMSAFNGHEVLFSYSGDGVYLYSTRDTPTDSGMRKASPLQSPASKRQKLNEASSSPESESRMFPDFLESVERHETALDERQIHDYSSEEEEEIREEDQYWPGVPCVTPRHRYVGARNRRTIKDVNFVGPEDELVASGSDDGNFFLWEKDGASVHFIGEGDGAVVNVIEPHPALPLLAISGIDHTIKLFAPKTGRESKFSRTDQAPQIMESNARPGSILASDLVALWAHAQATSEIRIRGGESIECINQ